MRKIRILTETEAQAIDALREIAPFEEYSSTVRECLTIYTEIARIAKKAQEGRYHAAGA